MNIKLIALTLLAGAALACAQEKLAREEALVYARAVSANAQSLKNTPIATDVDVAQPIGIRDEDYGGMVLPQKGLKPDTLATAGTTPVPIGQLWLHKLTPMRDGVAIPNDKLRLVTVNADGQEATVPQCTLAVRKNTAGKLELVVLGKSSDPILTTPLQSTDLRQSAPLDLEGERHGDSGTLRLRILGKFQAEIPVTELEL